MPRIPRPVGLVAVAAAALLATAGLTATSGLASATRTANSSAANTSAANTGASTIAAATGVGSGFWHTSGNQILDANGSPVRIAGINWYGFETPDEIAHGLWVQDYHSVINDIKNLGYNTIRIPFSNQMIESPVVPQNLSFNGGTGPINTDLEGLTSLQDLQKIVTYAGQEGLKVILDDHRSEAGESAENNGLWYTATYTSQNWVSDWVTLAKLFAGNPTVVGFDLRNEPHTPSGDTYGQAGATWGTGNTSTDVRLAYEQAGNAILAVDPNALIFCEGVSANPTAAGTVNTTWWGGDLAEAGQFPVVLSSPGHVVYSAHDYGPSLFQQTWFNGSTTAASLDAVWNQNWGYLYNNGTAPVWVGEFGTDNAAADVQSAAAGSQGQWFSDLVSYLHGNPWMGWTYWALNGEDSYDLLDNGYDPTPVSALKQSELATIQFALPGAQNGTPPPTGSAAPVSCSAVYSLTNSWAGGFQGQIVLTNTGTVPLSGWKLTWTFPGDQKIGSMWTASFTQSGESVTAVNEPYNASIPAAGSVTIGFTGTFTASDAAPTSFAVNGTPCGAA